MSTLSLRNVSYRPRTGSVASRNSTAFTPKLTPNKSQSNLSATPIRPPNFERQSSLPFPDDSMVLSPYHMIDGSGDLQLIRPQSIMSQTQNETLRNQSSLNKSHTKFFIQPGTRKLGTYVESKRFARRKADCSLTRILSYSKNGELDDENPTISYKQHVNLQQKKKTINKMIKTVFQKKDPIPVHPKTPTKLVQTFAHSTSAEHFSYMANNFQAGSPTNVVKLQQFLKAFKLPMTPQAQAFSHIANFSALETDSPYMGARGGNTSGREYPPQIPGFISLAESPTNKIIIRNRSGSINRTTTADMKNRQTITTRPGTTQSYLKRPGTSLKPSKTDTNLLKLNVNLNDNERTRLDNYMNMDFNDGLVYTDSVINLDKEKKNDEIKMENLTQVKQYLLEKAREGNHVTKLHQEYKSKIGDKLINSNGDKNKLLALSTSEPRDQEIPLGMPRTGNFELAHSDEYHLKSNVHKPFIGPNKNLLANPKENKGKLKKMISLHSTQFLSQFPSPASKHQRKLLKSMKTEDLWNIETKFERFRRIRKCLKEKLLLLSRMKISLEEFLVQKILPTQPYEHEYAEDFIKAAKRGDAEELEAMLKDAKQLIFQFDSSRQTALHWAAKRGHLEVIELLLRYGAEIDALDITFRTPIYYALREGSSEIVRILLLNKADPWSTRTTNYKTACSDFKCLRYLNRARKLSLILAFYDFRVRADIWSREAENMLAPVAEALRTEED